MCFVNLYTDSTVKPECKQFLDHVAMFTTRVTRKLIGNGEHKKPEEENDFRNQESENTVNLPFPGNSREESVLERNPSMYESRYSSNEFNYGDSRRHRKHFPVIPFALGAGSVLAIGLIVKGAVYFYKRNQRHAPATYSTVNQGDEEEQE